MRNEHESRYDAFKRWINTGRVGSVFVYYTGFLAMDRGTIIDLGGGYTEFSPNGDIDAIASLAIDAWDANRVHLFQRKLHDNEYEYIAMKRRPGGSW